LLLRRCPGIEQVMLADSITKNPVCNICLLASNKNTEFYLLVSNKHITFALDLMMSL